MGKVKVMDKRTPRTRPPAPPAPLAPPTLPLRSLKRALRVAGIPYGDVAEEAGVSWHMVYAVLSGRRVSAPVRRAAERLLGARAAGGGA